MTIKFLISILLGIVILSICIHLLISIGLKGIGLLKELGSEG